MINIHIDMKTGEQKIEVKGSAIQIYVETGRFLMELYRDVFVDGLGETDAKKVMKGLFRSATMTDRERVENIKENIKSADTDAMIHAIEALKKILGDDEDAD